MKILVLNSGSSSLKFQLIETSPEQISSNNDRLIARGSVERIGSGEAMVSFDALDRGKTKKACLIPDHKQALEAAFQALQGDHGVINDPKEIEAIGHRVVHGGEYFTAPAALITGQVLTLIEHCIDLAPLHNPPNLKGIYASRQLAPHAQNVAVFDTAFHQTLPQKAFLYGIPYVHYSRDKIRRYGFHGISHRYVSYRFGQLHNSTREAYKLITCHLGNGCSMAAIEHGRSVDTSMGFTPLEGLIMGTRSGSIDPGAVLYLIGRADMSKHEVEVLLNRSSGLYGLSGSSNDMRDLLTDAAGGDERARLAIDVFCYQIKRYIGSYYAAMNGADAIIFTGGIGENSPVVRGLSCEALDALGIKIDTGKNKAAVGTDADISSDDAKTRAWVIPTNEELLIARDTFRTILGIPHH
jgi:acetate kinase